MLRHQELEDDHFSVASNGVDTIAIAGEEKAIKIIFREDFSRATTATRISTPVRRLRLVREGELLLVLGSELDHAVAYDIALETSVEYNTPRHEGAVLWADVDPLGEFFASSGCDGHMNLYSATADPNTKPAL